MAALILNSLEVRRFRAFQHLSIEKLGRVNLIVGKNNVGKSCLLEALQLYASRAHPTFIWQILGAHDEDTRSARSGPGSLDYNVEEVLPIVKYLFHGRPDFTGPVELIEVGPINSPEEKLLVAIEFYTLKANEEGRRTLQLSQPTLFEEYAPVENPIPSIKAHLHTWLAWQEEPGKPIGQAITKRFLDPKAPHAQQFIQWIRLLFEIET